MYELNMLPSVRQQMILEFIQEKGSAQVKELAKRFQVSVATARRDLDEMAMTGMIERIHGGAIVQSSSTFELVHQDKIKVMLPEKKRIARKAASLVCDGDSVFLDSGTTTFFLAQELTNKKNLTVVTNNIDIASKVLLDESSTMIVAGGMRRERFSVLVGSITEDFLSGLYVDIVFMGCDAVSSIYGVFNSNVLEIGVKRLLPRIGNRIVLLTDNTKFRRNALVKVCELRDIDLVITDEGLEEKMAREIQEACSTVMLV